MSGSKLSAKRGPRVRTGAGGAPAAGPPSTQRGEKKMTARQSAALAAAEKRKKPKVSVGFGSRIESAKDKEKKERFAANALRSQSHSGKRNAGKVSAGAGDKSSPCRPSSMHAAPGGRATGGGGGFKQLQAQAAGGPKVVTYDDDPAPGNGRGYKQQASPTKRRAGAGVGGQSQELRGASDLLYIEGSDVDRISEDQLDKLLGKARGAR